jgi:hypothetical protein
MPVKPNGKRPVAKVKFHSRMIGKGQGFFCKHPGLEPRFGSIGVRQVIPRESNRMSNRATLTEERFFCIFWNYCHLQFYTGG